MASLAEAVTDARRQTALAYQFSPGSYTYSAFVAAAKAASILGVPDDDEGAL